MSNFYTMGNQTIAYDYEFCFVFFAVFGTFFYNMPMRAQQTEISNWTVSVRVFVFSFRVKEPSM